VLRNRTYNKKYKTVIKYSGKDVHSNSLLNMSTKFITLASIKTMNTSLLTANINVRQQNSVMAINLAGSMRGD